MSVHIVRDFVAVLITETAFALLFVTEVYTVHRDDKLVATATSKHTTMEAS